MNIARHRVLGAVEAGVGVVLLARPQALVHDLADRDARAARWVARLLGARMSAQGTAVGLSRDPVVMELGAAVDALHASSMLVLAARSPKWRRAATASAVVAGVAAFVGMTAGRPAHPTEGERLDV